MLRAAPTPPQRFALPEHGGALGLGALGLGALGCGALGCNALGCSALRCSALGCSALGGLAGGRTGAVGFTAKANRLVLPEPSGHGVKGSASVVGLGEGDSADPEKAEQERDISKQKTRQ
jgi:hypothetical protein